MANTHFSLNSIWPNGIKKDSDGYTVFYPLGTNKVDISSITWPEGTKVSSPFVYQDDKLVGFIDTKALEIDNNDTTIDINYTHFDVDLDSIMENTLTINAPANAAVNVKYGAVDKVLAEKIEKLIEKEKYEVKFDKNNNKVTIAVALDTTETQLAEVESLLNRVLPKDLAAEIVWPNDLPTTYTPLEYLESSGTQYIDTKLPVTPNTGFFGDAILGRNDPNFETLAGAYDYFIPLAYSTPNDGICFGYAEDSDEVIIYPLRDGTLIPGTKISAIDPSLRIKSVGRFRVGLNFKNSRTWEYKDDDLTYSVTLPDVYPRTLNTMTLFGRRWSGMQYFLWTGKIYSAIFTEQAEQVLNFIPCLDPTGAPCMFDTVTRTPFRNNGTGDFIIGIETQQQFDNLLDSFPNYTGQAIEKLQINLAESLQTPENEARLAEAMTQNGTMPAMLSLDGEYVAPKFYAKLTEHGIRRLYHVPRGYAGTMDEYAAANGFKELIEPPAPLEGYWMPEWRETETQLICDWVETEPPTEEVETLNNED